MLARGIPLYAGLRDVRQCDVAMQIRANLPEDHIGCGDRGVRCKEIGDSMSVGLGDRVYESGRVEDTGIEEIGGLCLN